MALSAITAVCGETSDMAPTLVKCRVASHRDRGPDAGSVNPRAGLEASGSVAGSRQSLASIRFWQRAQVPTPGIRRNRASLMGSPQRAHLP